MRPCLMLIRGPRLQRCCRQTNLHVTACEMTRRFQPRLAMKISGAGHLPGCHSAIVLALVGVFVGIRQAGASSTLMIGCQLGNKEGSKGCFSVVQPVLNLWARLPSDGWHVKAAAPAVVRALHPTIQAEPSSCETRRVKNRFRCRV